MEVLNFNKNKENIKIILASGSKQRQDIFKMIGLKFEVIKSLEEENSSETNPIKYVQELSKVKAISVSSQVNEKAIIIAADTILYMNQKKYEKPKSKEEAYENLKEMSGKTVNAVTGITIMDLYQNKTICFSDIVEVKFKALEDKEIQWYVDNESKIFNCCGFVPLGKAAIFIDKINGDYNTLFGISPSLLFSKLKEIGYGINDFEFEN